MTEQQSDPFGAFAFVISINGIATGFFQEVSGLSAQIDIQEVQEGGRNTSTRKLVGQGKFPNLVLKRGFCNETLLDALMGFHDNKTRLSGTISLCAPKSSGEVLASWKFKNGVPVKWDGPQLNVAQNAMAIESLEIAHEGLTRDKLATVNRQGSVTHVSNGPPPPTSSVNKTSSPYTENNVPTENVNEAVNTAHTGDTGLTKEAVNTTYDGNDGNINEAVNTAYTGEAGKAGGEGGGNISDLPDAKSKEGTLFKTEGDWNMVTWDAENSAVNSGGGSFDGQGGVAGGEGGGNISALNGPKSEDGTLFNTEGDWTMVTWDAENSAVNSGGSNITDLAGPKSNDGTAFNTEGEWNMLTWDAENSAVNSGGSNITDLAGPKSNDGTAFNTEGEWNMVTWEAENSAVNSGGTNISELNGPREGVQGEAFHSEGEWDMLNYGNAAELRANAAALSRGGTDDHAKSDDE